MPSVYDRLAGISGKNIDDTLASKKQSIANTQNARARRLDPSYTIFDPDEWIKPLDGDTLVHKTQFTTDGKPLTMRFALPAGQTYDTFEIKKDQIPEGRPGHDPYADNPRRADFHREALALQLGKDFDDISNQDLYNAGIAQHQRLIDGIESLRGQPMRLDRKGDKYGRALGRFENPDALKEISGGVQAGYTSPFNAQEQVADFLEDPSNFVKPQDRSLVEAMFQDSPVGFVGTIATVANTIAQFVAIGQSVASGKSVPPELNQFFENNRDRIKNAKEHFSTNSKNFRERMDAKEKQFLQEPLYNARVVKFSEEHPNALDGTIAFLAGIAEYGDRLEYLYENPGRILDASAESLPYMLGIGVIGKVSAKVASEAIGRGLANRLVKEGATNKNAIAVATEYLASKAGKAAVEKASSRAGILAIASSEAAMNAAEVYGQVAVMTPEELAGSERYTKLRGQNLSHEAARDILAKEAFNKIFYWNFAVAGFASKFSGAGAWESQLLRQFTNKTKKGFLRRTGNLVGESFKAGGREFVEESIQSGAGEALSQRGREETTGVQVGPGVGAATAEGGVVGFASGLGLSGAARMGAGFSKGFIKTTKNLNKKINEDIGAATENVTVIGADGAVGGGVNVDSTIKTEKQENVYQPEEHIKRMLQDSETAETTDEEASHLFIDMQRHWGEFKKQATDAEIATLEVSVKRFFDEAYVALNTKAIELTKEFSQEELFADPDKKAIIMAAAKYAGFQNPDTNSKMGQYLNAVRVTQATLETAQETADANEEILLAQGTSKENINRVIEEKMGYGVEGQLGLNGHVIRIEGAVLEGNSEEYSRFDRVLGNFIISQVRKLKASNELLERVTNIKDNETVAGIEEEIKEQFKLNQKITYKPQQGTNKNTGLFGFIALQTSELAEMGAVRQTLADQAVIEFEGLNEHSLQIAQQPIPGADLAQLQEAFESFLTIPSETSVDETAPAGEETQVEDSQGPEIKATVEAGSLAETESRISESRESELSTTEIQTAETDVEASAETQVKDGTPVPALLSQEKDRASDATEQQAEPKAKAPAAEVAEDVDAEIEEIISADSAENIQEEEEFIIPGINGPVIEPTTQTDTLAASEEETGVEEPTEPSEPIKLDEADLEKARITAEEIQSLLKEENVTLDDISFTSENTQEQFLQKVEEFDGDIRLAAEDFLTRLEVTHGESVIRSPTNRVNEEIETELIESTQTLLSGKKLKPTLINRLSNSVDFISEPLVRHLAALVGRNKLPTSNWTEKQLLDTRNDLKARFIQLKLPTQILQGIQNSRETVNSLLAAVPNVFSTLNERGTRSKFYRDIDASFKERQGFNGVINFVNNFVVTFNDLHLGLLNDLENPNSPFNKANRGAEGAAIARRLQEYSLQFLFQAENGEIDENFATIMALEAGNWLVGNGAGTVNKTNDSINSLLGRSSGVEITNWERERFGNGTLATTVITNIGNRVLRQANIALKNKVDLDPLFEEKLAVSIGTMVVSTLKKMDRVELHPIEVGLRTNLSNQVVDTAVNPKTIMYLIHNKTQSTDPNQVGFYQEAVINEQLRTQFQQARRLMRDVFSIDAYQRGPSDSAPPGPTHYQHSSRAAPVKHTKNLEKNSKHPWRLIPSHIKEFNTWTKERMLQVMGQKTEQQIETTIHIDHRSSIESKNARNIRSYNDLTHAINEWGTDEFYFGHLLISTGRNMIDSNMINPQGDKLHRATMSMSTHAITLKSTSLRPQGINHTNLNKFKSGLAFALDIDSSVLTTDEVITAFDARINSEDYQAALTIMRAERAEGVQYTKEEMDTIALVLSEDDGPTSLMALRAWADLLRAGDQNKRQVTVTAPDEADGKTNGYTSLSMQIVPNNRSILNTLVSQYQAGGIFFRRDIYKEYPDFAGEKGTNDNYQQVIKEMEKIVEAMRNGQKIVLQNPPLDNFGKELPVLPDRRLNFDPIGSIERNVFIHLDRSFAKSPLMIGAYGSQYQSIRKAKAEDQVREAKTELALAGGEVVTEENLEEAKKAYAILLTRNQIVAQTGQGKETNGQVMYEERLASMANITTVEAFYKLRTSHKIPVQFWTEYSIATDMLFGHALQADLEVRMMGFYDLRNDLNDAAWLANRIFVSDYKRRVAHFEKRNDAFLSEKDRQTILRSMRKQGLFPIVKSALSNTIEDGIELTNFQREPIDIKAARGRSYFSEKEQISDTGYRTDGSSFTPSSTHSLTSAVTTPTPNAEVGVRAVVNLILSSDGSVMSNTMGQYAALGLHDAIYMSPETVDEAGTFANQQFAEVHENWNMPAEILVTLERMLRLIAKKDSRLSEADKIEIYQDFLAHRTRFGTVAKTDTTPPIISFNTWIADLRTAIDENTEGRKKLHQQISHVANFAKEGTSHSVSDATGTTVPVKTPELAEAAETWRAGLKQLQVEEQERAWTVKKDAIIVKLHTAIHNDGNTDDILRDWFTATDNMYQPNAEHVLDVLFGAYQDLFNEDTDITRLRELINVTRAQLTLPDGITGEPRAIQVKMADSADMGVTDGRYDPDAGIIFLRSDARNYMDTLMHEIVHASDVRALENLRNEKEEDFNQLLKESLTWARRNVAAADGTAARLASLTILNTEDDVWAVAEYIAWLNTSLEVVEGRQEFVFGIEGNTALNALTRALQTSPNNKALYSASEQEIDQALFEKVDAQNLTAENLTTLFDKLKAIDTVTVTDGTQRLFDNLIKNFLHDGLQSIDTIIYKLATKTNGERNIGKVLLDENQAVTYLQTTSKNYFSSPLEQSAQELGIHEILHSIFKHAINQDVPTQLAITELLEFVFEALGPDGWKAFMPEVSIDQALDEKLAKQRYDHIFSPVRGKTELKNANQHEFMAIALSNPQFIEILKGLDYTNNKPVAEVGIIAYLLNLLKQALNFLKREATLADPKNMHEAVTVLAGEIITVNLAAQKTTAKKLRTAHANSKINKMNDAVTHQVAKFTAVQLQKWAERNEKTGAETDALVAEKNVLSGLILATKTATANSLLGAKDAKQFREAMETALSGLNKNGHIYQWLTEILPWADRNRDYVDLIRTASTEIDTLNQEIVAHTRKGLLEYFDPKSIERTIAVREAISQVFLDTDLSALMSGSLALLSGQILNLLSDPNLITQRILSLEAALDRTAPAELVSAYNDQSKSLARIQMRGISDLVEMPMTNIERIVKQHMFEAKDRIEVPNETEIIDILDHLTTLHALQYVSPNTLSTVFDIMEHEANRPVILNGFTGMLTTMLNYKKLAMEQNFSKNPRNMWKGHTAELFDEDLQLETVTDTPKNRLEMSRRNFTLVSEDPLPRDIDDPLRSVNTLLYKNKKGIAPYQAGLISLQDQKKVGTGLFDSFFQAAPGGTSKRRIAAVAHRQFKQLRAIKLQKAYAQQVGGAAVSDGPKMIPLFDENDVMIDSRYIMSRATKKEHLKRRDMFDELIPAMFATINNKAKTLTLNEEAVKAMHDDYLENKDNEDVRFLAVGRNVKSEEGRRLWDILPKATQISSEALWGAQLMYIRDDAANMVLGLRKMSIANNQFLGSSAPIVAQAEKLWQEWIQWERLKIAVLNPVVVFGNIISNYMLLLSQGIPLKYINRGMKQAVLGMNKYRSDLRKRNKLQMDINNLKILGQPTRMMEARLARFEAALQVNPVRKLVAEGLFTSIVEEFGFDEQSTRKKLTTRLMDRIGGVAGSKSVAKVTAEAFMFPGSNTFQFALLATQYGDFVGRFIKYNWDTQVMKMDERKAIHESLDTFIYYNLPQNKILLALNDNGALMFTKFFFRIQHIVLRTFKRNPVQTSLVFGLQQLTDNKSAEENILNYAFLNGGTGKFNPFIWDRIGLEALEPTIWRWFSWLPKIFWNPDST